MHQGVSRTMSTTLEENRTFSRRNLHGQVVHEIGTRIINGEFPPNSALPNETEFSEILYVSRTAYREAIKVLTAKGLVESRQKIGTTVRARKSWNILDPDVLTWIFESGPDVSYVWDLFELRRIIEPAAAGLAALRHTEETFAEIETAFLEMEEAGEDLEAGLEPDLRFHQAIFATTGNQLLSPLVYLIEAALAETIKAGCAAPGARLNSIPLHKEVLEAIRRRDQAGAEQATLTLLQEARSDMERALEISKTQTTNMNK